MQNIFLYKLLYFIIILTEDHKLKTNYKLQFLLKYLLQFVHQLKIGSIYYGCSYFLLLQQQIIKNRSYLRVFLLIYFDTN